MSNRREFLKHTAAAGVVATASLQTGCFAKDKVDAQSSVDAGNARPPRGTIKSLVRRDETIHRYPFSGDNWHMTWASDDRQYAALCDGYGEEAAPKGMWNSRLIEINGGPQHVSFKGIADYPEIMRSAVTTYYGFGTLAADERIYQFLTHFNSAVKLIYSPDNGRTWCNQDGSTPVVWEAKDRQSHETMAFFNEPQSSFNLLSIAQMGRGYRDNRDGYIYVYAPNGVTEGTMNELVMFRVPKARLLDRSTYEYFAGRLPNGGAKWTNDIGARAVVHTFPRGWVGKIPYCWQPSVTYNAPLGMFMMASWGWDFGAEATTAPSRPSYLGFWTAPHPWGPWTQIHEEIAWTPGGDPVARAYQPQIAPKWIAEDGKSFWLVWTDLQGVQKMVPEYDRLIKEKYDRNAMTPSDWAQAAALIRTYMPYYSFNAQRVDMVVV
jgi:hypothetical protein